MLLRVRLLYCLLLPLLQRGKGSPALRGVARGWQPGLHGGIQGVGHGVWLGSESPQGLCPISPLLPNMSVLDGSSPGPSGLPSEDALGRVCHTLPCSWDWCLLFSGCKGQVRARRLLLPFPWSGMPWHGMLGPLWLMPQSWVGTGAVPGCAALAPYVSLLQGVGTSSMGTSRMKVSTCTSTRMNRRRCWGGQPAARTPTRTGSPSTAGPPSTPPSWPSPRAAAATGTRLAASTVSSPAAPSCWPSCFPAPGPAPSSIPSSCRSTLNTSPTARVVCPPGWVACPLGWPWLWPWGSAASCPLQLPSRSAEPGKGLKPQRAAA